MRCQGAISGACGPMKLWAPGTPKTHMDEHYEHSGLLAAAPDKTHAQARGVEKPSSPARPHRHILQGCVQQHTEAN